MEHLEVQSILENPKIKNFISDREIRSEDLHLIEELAAFDKNLLIENLHNMFNLNREQSNRELISCIKTAQSENSRRLFEAASAFLNKYGWTVAWNLERVLEDL